jgi:hypothetical protein
MALSSRRDSPEPLRKEDTCESTRGRANVEISGAASMCAALLMGSGIEDMNCMTHSRRYSTQHLRSTVPSSGSSPAPPSRGSVRPSRNRRALARNARWLNEANWRKRLDTDGLCFPGGREEDEEKSAALQRSDVPHSLARGLIVSLRRGEHPEAHHTLVASSSEYVGY